MRSSEEKIRALNGILAGRSPDSSANFREAEKAIDFAFAQGCELNSIGEFAHGIIKFYDPEADLAFIDLGADYFDPLFKIEEIHAAAKLLAGSTKPILVVAGLDRASLSLGTRWTAKRRADYFSNLDIVETHVLRYELSIPQIEIIFV